MCKNVNSDGYAMIIFNRMASEALSNENRLSSVLQQLKERTSVTIPELAEMFSVSEMTIRRDLHKLAQSGEAIRIPGGARIARSFGAEKTFLERLGRMSEAKQKIGRAAAALVMEGGSAVLDSGTTTLQIARHLSGRRNIVVFTFSLAVVEELAGFDAIRLEVTGGTYRAGSHDLVGNAARESLESISADIAFFGAAAVSFRKGVMVNDPEAHRALLKAGRRRVLVVDSGKIGMEALYGLCPLSDCDLIITDDGITPGHLAELRKTSEVLVAE